MKKIYAIGAGFDIELTIEVDLEKLTPEMAAEINNFWSGAEDVLAAANGDVVEAALRRAAPILIHAAFDGCMNQGMLARLQDREGWPPIEELGITVLDYQVPELDPTSLEVFVQPNKAGAT